MKKLFISCPMKGRTEENIRKSMERMHKIAEIIFDQKLEVIPTYIEDNPSENIVYEGIWYLGKSIQLLSEADFFIGIGWTDLFKGCNIERTVAENYGMRCTYVDVGELMPDALMLEKEYWEKLTTPNKCSHGL